MVNHLTDRAQVLHRAVRHQQPQLLFDRGVAGANELHPFGQRRPVFRMDTRKNLFEGNNHVRVEFEDATEFL